MATRPYETVMVYDGTLPEETLQKERDSFVDFLSKNASFEKVDVWGKRELAYEINKRKIGNYALFLFSGEGSIVSQIERHVKLNEHVLRHLTVVRTNKKTVPDPVPETPAESEENPAPAAKTE